MKIRVTQEDIDQGRCKDPFYCPIACAIRRLNYDEVAVYRSRVYVNGRRYKAPPEMRQFTTDFDFNIPVVPSTFELVELDDGEVV